MNVLKSILIFIVLLGICGYAIWQGLQIVSIVSLILLLGLLYKRYTRQGIDILLSLLKNTKQAKFGQLEISIEKKIAELSKLAINRSVLMNIILSKLDPEHLGLLITIFKEGKHRPIAANKNRLRDLRSFGLLHHNNPTMADSTEVWLTNLGNEIADALSSETIDLITQPK